MQARLARVLLSSGRVTEARALAERAAAIGEAEQAAWPAEAAVLFESLARVLVADGHPARAVSLWQRTLDLRLRAQNAGPPAEAVARAGLGHALALAGRADEGLPLLESARAALARRAVWNHPDLREIDAHVAEVTAAPR